MALGVAREQAARRADAPAARGGDARAGEPYADVTRELFGLPGGARPTARLPNAIASIARFSSAAATCRGVALRVDLLEHVRDASVGADQERRAHDAHVRLAVVHLLLPHAVLLGHRVVGVGEQRERELELLLELRLRRDGVGADAEDHCIESLEPREGVAKLARLDGSPRGVGLGIEVQHDGLAAWSRERERLAFVGQQREVRWVGRSISRAVLVLVPGDGGLSLS